MRKKIPHFLICALLSAMMAAGCMHSPTPIPSAQWRSMHGHPDIRTTDSMTLIVYHPTDCGVCPISYPIRTDPHTGRYYISAAIRIFISYDSETGELYLSPGGEYLPLFTKQ